MKKYNEENVVTQKYDLKFDEFKYLFAHVYTKTVNGKTESLSEEYPVVINFYDYDDNTFATAYASSHEALAKHWNDLQKTGVFLYGKKYAKYGSMPIIKIEDEGFGYVVKEYSYAGYEGDTPVEQDFASIQIKQDNQPKI